MILHVSAFPYIIRRGNGCGQSERVDRCRREARLVRDLQAARAEIVRVNEYIEELAAYAEEIAVEAFGPPEPYG